MNFECFLLRIPKTCRLREKPGPPFWRSLSALPCSWMQTLSLRSRYRNRNCHCCLLSWNFFLFRSRPILNLLLPNLKIFRLHEKPGLPFWRFLSVLLYSWKQNLSLKFHYRNLSLICCRCLLNWSLFLFRSCLILSCRGNAGWNFLLQ